MTDNDKLRAALTPEEVEDWRSYAEGQKARGKFVTMQPDEFLTILDAANPAPVGLDVDVLTQAMNTMYPGEAEWEVRDAECILREYARLIEGKGSDD